MTVQTFGAQQAANSDSAPDRPARSLWPAIRRGLLGKCPNCGEGRLFRAFVKTVDRCEHCGEDISHHRADDLPAYLVIVIVGHIVVSGFMAMELLTEWSSWQHLALWVPITIMLSILLLQPVKGAVVGLQWALFMHGFGGAKEALETHPEA